MTTALLCVLAAASVAIQTAVFVEALPLRALYLACALLWLCLMLARGREES